MPNLNKLNATLSDRANPNEANPHWGMGLSQLSDRLDTNEASAFIGFKPSTLKLSRVTGTLAGVNAPMYRKLGRKVVYDRVVLVEWLNQFKNQANTAA